MKTTKKITSLYIILLLCFCAGCTTLKISDDPALQTSADPFESLNRTVYGFNNVADKAVLKPVSKAYKATLPTSARYSISRFFSNLSEPLSIVNNLLQGKVDGALQSTYRFTVNSTIGVLGLFDVAKQYDVEPAREDLGQTLAAWGVKPGPYVMLPLLGPSNLRDSVSGIAQSAVFYQNDIVTDSRGGALALTALNAVNARSSLLAADAVLDAQLDPYAFIKIAFEENRAKQVYDNRLPKGQGDDEFDF